MAYPEERSIFEELFLPRKKSRGPKFLLATAVGIGVAALIVVSSLAAGGGPDPSKVTTQPQDVQPSSAGLLGGGKAPSQPSTDLTETTTPTATVTPVATSTLPPATSTPAPTTAPTMAPTSTAVPVQQSSTAPVLPSESRDSLPLPTETPVPQQPASLLAAAPTSTPVTQSLAQQAVSTPTPTQTATPTPTRTPTPTATKAPLPPATGLNALERDMFNMHNAARAEEGVKALAVDADAVAVARFRAQEMLDEDYFSHSSPTGNTAAKLLADSDASYRSWAENIAYNVGYGSARTVQVAMYGESGDGGLMNSPGHYKNIMNASYGRVGIGVASSGSTFYYAIIFLGP